MFEDKDLTTIIFYVIGVWVIISVIQWRISKNAPPMKKALNSFTASLIMVWILMFALLFSLPPSFRFESYGYPEEFKSLEEVHKYLQQHNRSLAKLREVIYWFIFFFTISFLPTLHGFAKAIAEINDGKKDKDN